VLFNAGRVNQQVVVSGNGTRIVARQLSLEELSDAAGILLQLSYSAVLRPEVATVDDREIFFSRIHGWELPIEQLRVRWSERAKVAVCYQANLAVAFRLWASTFQPELLELLDKFGNEFVVVAIAFVPIDEDVQRLLESERNKIWRRHLFQKRSQPGGN
jgi:hypothetical protein